MDGFYGTFYKNKIMTINHNKERSSIYLWLESSPLNEELREKDGAKYIPYHIIIEKLNYLCKDGHWSAFNFLHTYYTLKNGKTIVSGSIDIEVSYKNRDDSNETVMRRLSGAATFALSKSSNPHPAASVKSLAIMNAVKPLGKQFGWGLNGFENENIFFPDDKEDVLEAETPNPIKEKIIKATTLEDLTALKKDLPPSLMSAYMEQMRKLTKQI